MTEITRGGCVCGSVRYEFTGEPVITYKCYCSNCQRASGSGYLPVLWAPAKTFKLLQGEVRYHYVAGESGREVGRGYCVDCGSPVMGKLRVPGIIPVVASSLDEPQKYRPMMQIWTMNAKPWDTLAPELETYETQFTPEQVRQWLSVLRQTP